MSLTWLSNTNIKKPKCPKPNGKRQGEPSMAERERIHTVQSHCQASLCRLAALVPMAPWWFHRTVQSRNHRTTAMPLQWPKPIKNQWRRTKKNEQKNQEKRVEIWVKPRSEKLEKIVEIWATQIETNRLRITNKNSAQNVERGRNPRSKHKPEMQTKLETQPKIHAETQTQTPKPIPKHKHSPKFTLKHKHKCQNPYQNRNTNVEMGQRWRLRA